MMARKHMIKLQPVMIELIILIILEVYANDLIPLSPTPTLLPTSLQRPFQLDHEEMTYIHRCLEFTLMLRLFWRKMISEKWFRYFSVLGRGKNNGQPENDFRLTKNA
jgi:hypothetical protein